MTIDACQAQIIRMNGGQPDIDFKPVVKLFTPNGQRHVFYRGNDGGIY